MTNPGSSRLSLAPSNQSFSWPSYLPFLILIGLAGISRQNFELKSLHYGTSSGLLLR